MKVNFQTIFNKAHRALTSGKYQIYSPAKKGFPYVETGYFVARDNKNFPLFKIGSSLVDVEKQKNIYVKRFNPAKPKEDKWTHFLVLTDDNTPYVPGRKVEAYYFSHHDYLQSGELFHAQNDLRQYFSHDWTYEGQDLSKNGFYARVKYMYSEVVDKAKWYKDTLKYIRDAIEIFANSASK